MWRIRGNDRTAVWHDFDRYAEKSGKKVAVARCGSTWPVERIDLTETTAQLKPMCPHCEAIR